MNLFIISANRLRFRSDGSTSANSGTDMFDINNWTLGAITRTAAGVVNFYKNAVLNGSADQDSGTPVAGTTNLIVGATSTASQVWDGKIEPVRCILGILTTKEISQWVSSTRHRYNI